MSVVVVNRPPRVVPAAVPSEPVPLPVPPTLPADREAGTATALLPTAGMGIAAVLLLLPGSAPFMKVMGGLLLAATAALAVTHAAGARGGPAERLGRARDDYFTALAGTRARVRRTARAQRAAQLRLHPAPDQLWAVAADHRRLWERRPGDGDFARIRFGVGVHPLATALVVPAGAPQGPVGEPEPLTGAALRRFAAAHGSLSDLPVTVGLRDLDHVVVCGDPRTVPGAARAAVAQLAVLHAPTELVIAVVTAGPESAARWDWVKWLPHAQHESALDDSGSRRLVCQDPSRLRELLAGRLAGRLAFAPGAVSPVGRPHVVVVVDAPAAPAVSLVPWARGRAGVTLVEVAPGEPDPRGGGLPVVVRPGSLAVGSPGGRVPGGRPDTLSLVQAQALARQLAPLRLAAEPAGSLPPEAGPRPSRRSFGELLGLGDLRSIDVDRAWRPRPPRERLRVPVGTGESGEPVVLDLKDAASGGTGPHGLVAGSPGSGTSEFLRTTLLALAVTHSPDALGLVLADFQGGGAFAGLERLPHTAAVVTGPPDDPAAAGRLRDLLRAELGRRREYPGRGGFADVHGREGARAAGAAPEPPPALVVAVDGVAELLRAAPGLADDLLLAGRAGGESGVHLLLASRDPARGLPVGLESCLSYRAVLRTRTPAESTAVLGGPDAFHLPALPGAGLLRCGAGAPVRFTAPDGSGGPGAGGRRAVLFTAAGYPDRSPGAAGAGAGGRSSDAALEAVVRRLGTRGRPTRPL